jgi:uncharacterized membrane protein YkoI
MDKKEMNEKVKKEISKKAKKFIFPAVATAVIIGGGFSYVAYAQTSEENQIQAELAKQAKVTEEEAIKIALEEVPGTVEKVELEDEDGTIVYEIEIRAEDGTEQEVEIDATTGDVVKVEAEDDEEGDEEQSQAELAKQAKVTEEEAIKIALEEVPGTVEKVELEDENGAIIYDIEIRAEDGTEQEVEIDAATGDVVKVEHEDNEENHDTDEVDDQE